MPEPVKPLIFIDANIYLRFFDSNRDEYRKLLIVLKDIKSHIFVTHQVVSEVMRNKLSVVSQGFNNYLSSIANQNIKLPVHFDAGEDARVMDWNTSWKSIQDRSKDLKAQLQELKKQILEEVSSSEDFVSNCLAEIFELSHEPSHEEIEKAKLRKDLGNPPGKKSDPIGDELSWEQLLGKISGVKSLWIISNDNDFFLKDQDNFYLNSFLYHELKSKSSDIEIEIFDTLSHAIDRYKDIFSEERDLVPPDVDMEKIQQEERYYFPPIPIPISDPPPIQSCPSCQQVSLVPQLLPTGYVLRCLKCGYSSPLYEDSDSRFF